MTDRKLTCVACKSAITEGDIAHSDLEFGGELKATNQPEYTADADTDLVATVGILDGYTPMVRTTGAQRKTGQLISETEGGFVVERDADYSIAFIQKNTGTDRDSTDEVRRLIPLWLSDKNDKQMVSLRYNKANKTHTVFIRIVDSTGIEHDTTIASYTEL